MKKILNRELFRKLKSYLIEEMNYKLLFSCKKNLIYFIDSKIKIKKYQFSLKLKKIKKVIFFLIIKILFRKIKTWNIFLKKSFRN